MAEPLTIGIIGAAIGAIGAATGATISTVGAVQQHRQASANAQAQADMLDYNRRQEEREASRIEAENAESARRQRDQASIFKAQQRALLGKSGAAMASGSPLAILGETAADQEMTVQDVHTAGYQAAAQHREQAKMYSYQAGVAKASAPSSLATGLTIAGAWNNAMTRGSDSILNYKSMDRR